MHKPVIMSIRRFTGTGGAVSGGNEDRMSAQSESDIFLSL